MVMVIVTLFFWRYGSRMSLGALNYNSWCPPGTLPALIFKFKCYVKNRLLYGALFVWCMYVCTYCMYVCMVITYVVQQSIDQPVANPARGQLNKENEYFPVSVRA